MIMSWCVKISWYKGQIESCPDIVFSMFTSLMDTTTLLLAQTCSHPTVTCFFVNYFQHAMCRGKGGLKIFNHSLETDSPWQLPACLPAIHQECIHALHQTHLHCSFPRQLGYTPLCPALCTRHPTSAGGCSWKTDAESYKKSRGQKIMMSKQETPRVEVI